MLRCASITPNSFNIRLFSPTESRTRQEHELALVLRPSAFGLFEIVNHFHLSLLTFSARRCDVLRGSSRDVLEAVEHDNTVSFTLFALLFSSFARAPQA